MMKKIIKHFATLFTISLIFTACSVDDPNTNILNSEEEVLTLDTDQNFTTKAISSTQWTVQTLGKTGRSFTKNVPGRYKRTNSYLVLNVLGNDRPVSRGSRYPRTELRGKKEFKPSDNNGNPKRVTHAMYVTLKVEKLNIGNSKLIIGQIFNKDVSDDYGTVFIRNNKLYAKFDGSPQVELDNRIDKNKVSYAIVTNNGTTTIAGNGKSTSSRAVRNNKCYFKAGVYLLSTNKNHRAQVRIRNLSQR